MKRILIVSTLILFMYGCSKAPVSTGFNIEAITSEANKSSFFSYSIKLPTLSGSNELISFSKTLRDGIDEEKDALAKQAQQNEASEGFHPYEYHVDYQTTESDLLTSNSLLVTTYSYTGGANGIEKFKSFNFINGTEVMWSTIFNESAESIVVGLINDRLEQDGLLPINQRSYFSRASIDSLEDTSWYLDNDILAIVFPLFSIAPHSAGIVHMAFSIESLIEKGAVKLAFMPTSNSTVS